MTDQELDSLHGEIWLKYALQRTIGPIGATPYYLGPDPEEPNRWFGWTSYATLFNLDLANYAGNV